MDAITHRQMRNSSGEILRRVEAGESFLVTNNGHPAAVITPATGATLDGLIARGEARGAISARTALLDIPPVDSPVGSEQLVEDARGPW